MPFIVKLARIEQQMSSHLQLTDIYPKPSSSGRVQLQELSDPKAVTILLQIILMSLMYPLSEVKEFSYRCGGAILRSGDKLGMCDCSGLEQKIPHRRSIQI